jgi:hypothetical protein
MRYAPQRRRSLRKSENTDSIRRYFHPRPPEPRPPVACPHPSSNHFAILAEREDDTEASEPTTTTISHLIDSLQSITPTAATNLPPAATPHCSLSHKSVAPVPSATPLESTASVSDSPHTPCNLHLHHPTNTPRRAPAPHQGGNPFNHGLQRIWAGAVTSEQLAMAIHPGDIDRFLLLPASRAPLYQQLLANIQVTSTLDIAICPGRSDYSFTPGRGICPIAALGMISHCCAQASTDSYPTLSLDNFAHRSFLRSIIARLQALLLTTSSHPGRELRTSLRSLLKIIPPTGPIVPCPAQSYMPSDHFLIAAKALSLPIVLWSAHHDPSKTPVRAPWVLLEDLVDPSNPSLTRSSPLNAILPFLAKAHHVALHNNHYFVLRPENMPRDTSECMQKLASIIHSRSLAYSSVPSIDPPGPQSLPHSSPHTLTSGQCLLHYEEPLTILIPASDHLTTIIAESVILTTPHERGDFLKTQLENKPIFHVCTTLSTDHPSYDDNLSSQSAYLILFQIHNALHNPRRAVLSSHAHHVAPHLKSFLEFLQLLLNIQNLTPMLSDKLTKSLEHYTSDAHATLPSYNCPLPHEFRLLLSFTNPRASMWAASLPPHIHLLGYPCPSISSPFGTTASQLHDLISHPAVLFHDSGYSILPLPFSNSHVEAAIASLHNMLLSSTSSNLPQHPSRSSSLLTPLRQTISPDTTHIRGSPASDLTPSQHRPAPAAASQHCSTPPSSLQLLTHDCSTPSSQSVTPLHPPSMSRHPPILSSPKTNSGPTTSIRRRRRARPRNRQSTSHSDSDSEPEAHPNPPARPITQDQTPRRSPRLLHSANSPENSPPLSSLSPADTILDDLHWDPSAVDRVHIKLSQASPDAGKGAFATIPFGIDDTICAYFGDPSIRLTPRQAQSPNYISDYVLVIDHVAIDAQDRKTLRILSGAGYINEAFDEHRANCIFLRRGNRIVVVATRDIQPGEELLILYGELYWRTSRWSLSLLRQASLHYSTPSSKQLWSDLIHYAEVQERQRSNPLLATDTLSVNRREDSLIPILPLKHSWVLQPVPHPSSFKFGSWNIGSNLSNPSAGSEKLDCIIKFFLSSGMSCLFLLDVRQTKASLKFLQFTLQQHIPGAAVLIFPATQPPLAANRRQVTMGGSVILIHPNWRHAMVRAKADKSGLSIITKVTFKIASRLPHAPPQLFEIIGAYIPPQASNHSGPCTLHQRLRQYLNDSSSDRFSSITHTSSLRTDGCSKMVSSRTSQRSLRRYHRRSQWNCRSQCPQQHSRLALHPSCSRAIIGTTSTSTRVLHVLQWSYRRLQN